MIQFSLTKKLKSPGGEMVLNMSMAVKPGQLAALYGPSGAGKTSVLRMLAGLLHPDDGVIEVNGEKWCDTSEHIWVRPQQRKIGYVFQESALFPNMTVRENLEYALSKGQDDRAHVEQIIDRIHLHDLLQRMPATLSGGQRQRVALARALVRRPQLLLLDEPLSSLDHDTRSMLQDQIVQVHRDFNLTTVLVSHEISEVFKMADHIVVLENGRVMRQGTPSDIFSSARVSGKFQFSGTIVNIEKEDVVYIVSVLVGNQVVKVIADEKDIQALAIGNKVLVASKAFNPLIQKIE